MPRLMMNRRIIRMMVVWIVTWLSMRIVWVIVTWRWSTFDDYMTGIIAIRVLMNFDYVSRHIMMNFNDCLGIISIRVVMFFNHYYFSRRSMFIIR